MAKKKTKLTPQERFAQELHNFNEELKTTKADLEAFLTGGIGPTQQEYIDKINSNWNGYNFIVQFGHVYRLCGEKKQKRSGALYSPCELCELSEYCIQDSDKKLCALMQAEEQEYFRDEGELVIDKKGKMKIEPW